MHHSLVLAEQKHLIRSNNELGKQARGNWDQNLARFGQQPFSPAVRQEWSVPAGGTLLDPSWDRCAAHCDRVYSTTINSHLLSGCPCWITCICCAFSINSFISISWSKVFLNSAACRYLSFPLNYFAALTSHKVTEPCGQSTFLSSHHWAAKSTMRFPGVFEFHTGTLSDVDKVFKKIKAPDVARGIIQMGRAALWMDLQGQGILG